MSEYDNTGLLLENYKSFGKGLAGFESIAPINVIVGRNNSGKSALLDLVQFACQPAAIPLHLHHASAPARVVLSALITEHSAKNAFSPTVSGGEIPGPNHWAAGQQLLGGTIQVELDPTGSTPLLGLSKDLSHLTKRDLTSYYNRLASTTINPFKGKFFHRLSAERDVVPENDTGNLQIQKNGQGFTSFAAQILNKAEHPSDLVADTLLGDLNKIFYPDTKFASIVVQQYGEGSWEIFLQEVGKGRIALTHSGSGIKTILLVIGFFVLLPYLYKSPLAKFIFAFEELENNLHPALQRRLLRYISETALQNKTLLFLTTHSNVAIDFFSHDADAQIIHVTHAVGKSQARRVQTYVDNHGVLDDLDVRASDLLQANGIVWLEGPSDRLYFNRWIELFTDGAVVEGAHYQCVFYGGRLLAHLSAKDPEIDAGEVLKILRVNRNAIVLIDSDKSSPESGINETKKRIAAEMESIKGMAWITKGREVENYLPLAAVKAKYDNAAIGPGQFEEFVEYVDNLKHGEGKRFERSKVLFAESVLSAMTKENVISMLDMAGKLEEAVDRIRSWNGLR